MKSNKLQKTNYKRALFEICNLKFAISRKGIASLPAILLMSAIIIEIGIASVFLLTYLNNSVYGTRLANQAFMAARSGINDAVARIILNKNCGVDASCAPTYPGTYTITVGTATTDVSICKDTCVGSGKDQIIAIGRALTRQHRIVAIANVDPTTGMVVIESIKDEPQN